MSAEGKVFFINHNNKTTHWARPDPPPVQPSDSPAEDIPPSKTTSSALQVLDRVSSNADKRHSPFPAAGSDHGTPSPVSSVSDLAAVPFVSADPYARDNGAALAEMGADEGGVMVPKEELPQTAAEAEFESVHLEEVDGASGRAGIRGTAGVSQQGYPKRPRDGELSKRIAGAGDAVAPVLLEEVEGTPDSGTGVQHGDPKRAPSATVVAAALPGAGKEEEGGSISRSMGAVPTNVTERSSAGAAMGAGAGAASSAGAADLDALDDDRAEGGGGGGGPGPVSSIVKSGLFGTTVARPNSPVRKGTNGSSSSGAPTYASSSANVAAAAAAAVDELEPEPELEEAPLSEGTYPPACMNTARQLLLTSIVFFFSSALLWLVIWFLSCATAVHTYFFTAAVLRLACQVGSTRFILAPGMIFVVNQSARNQ